MNFASLKALDPELVQCRERGGAIATTTEERAQTSWPSGTTGALAARRKHWSGKDHQAYLWQYSRPGAAVVFDFRMGREREGPKRLLANVERLQRPLIVLGSFRKPNRCSQIGFDFRIKDMLKKKPVRFLL